MNSDNEYFNMFDYKRVAQLIRNSVIKLSHRFFEKQNFVYVDPPILHESIINKKNEIYISDFDNKFSLNSSNALYLGAYASEFKHVYAISPCFRNEKDSINHLMEFRMLEVEVIDMNFDEMIEFIINYIKYILRGVSNEKWIKDYPLLLKRDILLLEKFDPKKISYEEFVDMIRTESDYTITEETDLSDIDYIVSKYIDSPIIIVDYPQRIASWTSKLKSNGSNYAMNLILPETYGELAEGCERTNDTALLQYKMDCANITNLQWYIEAVRNIYASRCGFGMGIDRLIRWIIGSKDIKETVLFPRVR